VPGSSWTLFGGIGSTGSDQKARKPAIEFSVPVVTEHHRGPPVVKEYEGGSFDLDNLTVVKFVEKYRSAANGAGREAAYTAYRIYQAEKMCAEIQETEYRRPVVLDDETEACVGLPPTWRYERYQFLKRAAQGGIEGAAIDFYQEGAFGNTTAGPIPADWAYNAINLLQASGERGDIYALHTLSYVYQQGQLVS